MKLLSAACAPVKAIISGEHAVVHGGPGVAIALEPCNKVEIFEVEETREGSAAGREAGSSAAAGLVLESDRGSVFISAQGVVEGTDAEAKVFEPFVATVNFLREKENLVFDKRFVAKIISAKAPKGTGNSASIASALALALLSAFGKKPLQGSLPEEDELWMATQAAEEKAHGARPSGIDAMTVCRGNTQLLRSVENGKVKWNFTPMPKLCFPSNTSLLVVDTFKGGQRANTGALVLAVAKSLGLTKNSGEGKEVVKPLNEFEEEDKLKVLPFKKVFDKILAQLNENGDAKALGKAMLENHELLRKSGASTADIETVIQVATSAGAYGAKLTGAGGNGGAVIVLVENSCKNAVENAIVREGFSIFEATASKQGSRVC